MAICVAIFAFIFVSIAIAANQTQTTADQPSPNSATTDSSVNDMTQGTYDGVAFSQDTNATCSGTNQSCWVWNLTADRDCPTATITLGFSNSATGDVVRTEQWTQVLWANKATPFEESADGVNEKYAGIEKITCKL